VCDIRRIYVSDEAYRRLKLYSVKYMQKMSDVTTKIICDVIGEDGEPKKPIISEDMANTLCMWSRELGISTDELIMRMVKTISVLYNERLRLADVLNIPRLEKIVRERG